MAIPLSRFPWPPLAGLLAGLLLASAADAQVVDPQEFGINLPVGKVRYSDNERYVVQTDAGDAVTTKLHAEVGAHRILMLPDGKFIARPNGETTPTDRPFQPAAKDALAKKLLGEEFLGFKSNETKRYLYIYNTSEEFALATSRILETMFPGVMNYAAAQSITTHEPEVPLVVIMFRTEDEFQRYKQVPAGVIAYYNTVNNQVVMYEQSSAGQLAPDVAIQQSLSTIAHEGAHQILHNIGVQQRLSRWPMWLSEGLAEFFAPTRAGRRLHWKGAGQVNDLRMFELEQYIKGRSSNAPNGQMVEHTVLAGQLTSTGYASAWALTHYLAKNKRVEFNAYVKTMSELRPLEGFTKVVPPGVIQDNLSDFTKHFGDDLTDCENRLVLHLKKQDYVDPFADAPHFVAMILVRDGNRALKEANVFHTQSQALQWQEAMLGRVDDNVRRTAQTRIDGFPNRRVAEQFASRWLATP